ncbi:MAG: hypothetical protein ABIH82_03290 [Candidatus Woesearchaeota archaeon]
MEIEYSAGNEYNITLSKSDIHNIGRGNTHAVVTNSEGFAISRNYHPSNPNIRENDGIKRFDLPNGLYILLLKGIGFTYIGKETITFKVK